MHGTVIFRLISFICPKMMDVVVRMTFQLHDIHLLISPYDLKPGRMGKNVDLTQVINGSQNLKDCFIKCANVYGMI